VSKLVSPEELSAEELRRLLIEKRRASRQDRLERYRRTGRVVLVAPDTDGSSLENMRTGEFDDPEEVII
jgi:sortase A